MVAQEPVEAQLQPFPGKGEEDGDPEVVNNCSSE